MVLRANFGFVTCARISLRRSALLRSSGFAVCWRRTHVVMGNCSPKAMALPLLSNLGDRSAGVTTIEVIKGFDMPRMDLTGDSDCYAVVTVVDMTTQQPLVDPKRTAPHYNQRNPVVRMACAEYRLGYQCICTAPTTRPSSPHQPTNRPSDPVALVPFVPSHTARFGCRQNRSFR